MAIDLLADAKKQFTEAFFYDLSNRCNGVADLLSKTSGRPRHEVEFIIQQLFPEKDLSSSMIKACCLLLDKELLLESLEALPEGDE